MTVIRPNSISGINSITAQAGALNFYDSTGSALPVSAGAINVSNVNSTGVSTFVDARITGGSITGVSTIGVTTVTATNLTVNGNSYPSTGPLSNRNLIINGAMQVAQRGTSGTAGGYETVDRFLNDHGGGGAITQSQVALTTGSPYNEGFRYFWRQTNTTASTAAGRYMRLLQLIEAQNMSQSGWNYTSSSSYVTLSFWVRSSVAQEFYGVLNTKDGTSRNYPFSTGTLVADTWTKVTKTIPGDSNITFDNDNGNGLQVEFIPFYGTNFTDSAVTVNTWANYAGGSRVPDMTSTWANTTNATFDITGVQLELGEVATPFEHRSFGDELAKCQRYFYMHADGSQLGPNNRVPVSMAAAYTATSYYGTIHFPVSMRTYPTLYKVEGTSYFRAFGNAASDLFDSITLQESGRNAYEINYYGNASATQGYAYWVSLENSAARIGFSAEL